MKVIADKPALGGVRRVTVELARDEQLIALKQDAFYKLGQPLEDIVGGHHIAAATQVSWCAVSQGWVE